MIRKLPVLSLLWVATMASSPNGASGQQPPAEPSGTADPAFHARSLLLSAVLALEGRDSVTAKVRYEVDVLGKHLVGSGTYLEQRQDQNRLLRLELKTQLGEKSTNLVQVCDGPYLWTYRKLPSEVRLTRISVDKANQAIQQAERAPRQPNTSMLPGLGGLPKLLRSLDIAFDFTLAEQGRWGKKKQPVWRLHGQWKPDLLVKLLPNQNTAIERGESPDLGKLPEYLPDQVVLLLGQEDLFPYRVEFRRRLPEKQVQPGGPTSRPLVTMDLFEVNINVPIDPMQFVYNPGSIECIDQTDAFVQSLRIK